MKIHREFETELTIQEEIQVIRKMSRTNSEVIRIILLNPKGYCPFPDMCNLFPCKTLSCDADVCSNGYAYRMS